MTVVITRKTYDRVVSLCPGPRTPNPRHLSAELVILDIPAEIGNELHRIHPHTEEAICRLLEVEHLAQHPGWRTRQKRKIKRTLHTVSFVYEDNGQHYNEGAMLSTAEANQVRVLLEGRESRNIISDVHVGPDAKPISFAECMKSLRENSALQWEEA